MKHFEEDHWWFIGTRAIILDRIKLLMDIIRKSKKLDNVKILDIGCGTGNIISLLRNKAEVYGVDYSAEAVRIAKNRKLNNIYLSNAEYLPFGNKNFDLVLMLDLLEHVPDDKIVLNEAHRVLKSGGFIIITVPANKNLYDIALSHYRRYSKNELINLIDPNKFNIDKISFYDTILYPFIYLYRMINKRRKKFESDLKRTNFMLNKIFIYILNFEKLLLRKFYLGYGLSLLLILKKI
jgi:ubiquinone/menaquinone biosynthesis C-methylase UbiE